MSMKAFKLPDYPVKKAFNTFIPDLSENRALALEAPTGSGKTTLLPILLMQSGLSSKKILLTQPRRLAAKSVANRMAWLTETKTGELAGYRVRGESNVSSDTKIEVVTEGWALAMLQADPFLSEYDWIILDEFHERHIECDLLLTFMRDLQQSLGSAESPGIIVMTATWQGQPRDRLREFSFHSIKGRLYPVEKIFFKAAEETDFNRRLKTSVEQAMNETIGKILVFLPGRRELEESRQLLSGLYPDTEISLLYGGLELNDQQRILLYEGSKRQIILATSVAETSLTIEGVTAVVDSGLERLPVYQPAQGLTRLITRRLSRATSIQRAGRAGRLGPGKYYSLWTQSEDLEIVERWDPEILTGDLSRARLQTAVWGGDKLPWITPPPQGPWEQAGELLRQLGAIENDGRITERGKMIASLPLPPRLAHMVISVSAAEMKKAALAAVALSEGHRFSSSAESFSDRLAEAGSRREFAALRNDAAEIEKRIRTAGRSRSREESIGTISVGEVSVGGMLSLAYPDRIGRKTAPGEYGLVTGAALRCRSIDADWAVFSELTGSPGRLAGRLAEPLSFDEVLNLHPQMIAVRRKTEITGSGRIKVERTETFGSIILKELPADVPTPDEQLEAVKAAVKKKGITTLPVEKKSRVILERLVLAKKLGIEGLPNGDADTLCRNLEGWLGSWLHGELNADIVRNALAARLSWEQKNMLDKLFPQYAVIRPGQKKEIDYSNPEQPLIRGRIQEFYGINKPLSIAGGRLRLSIELLSPAMRPLQTTSDPGEFWKGSYHQIRSEMRGRYPKHYWPGNPADAEPSLATGKKRPEQEL